jgi:iron complex outermembrane receptor protein
MSLRTTLLTASALTALIAAPVLAQEAATSDATTEVIVTGSRGKPRTVTSANWPAACNCAMF